MVKIPSVPSPGHIPHTGNPIYIFRQKVWNWPALKQQATALGAGI